MHVTSHTPLAQLLDAPATLDALEAALDALKDQPVEDTLAALKLIALRGATPIQIEVPDASASGRDEGEDIGARWASALHRAALDAESEEAVLAALEALTTPLRLRTYAQRLVHPAQLPAVRQQVILPLMARAAASPPAADPWLVSAAASYFLHAQLPADAHDPVASKAGLHHEPTDALFVKLLPLANDLQLVAWLNRLISAEREQDRERVRFVTSRAWPELLLTRDPSPNILTKLLSLGTLSPELRVACAKRLCAARNPHALRLALLTLAEHQQPLDAEHLPLLLRSRIGASDAELPRLNGLIKALRDDLVARGAVGGALTLADASDAHGALSITHPTRGAIAQADEALHYLPPPHNAHLIRSSTELQSAWIHVQPAPRPEFKRWSSALLNARDALNVFWCCWLLFLPALVLLNTLCVSSLPSGAQDVALLALLFAPYAVTSSYLHITYHTPARSLPRLLADGHATLARVDEQRDTHTTLHIQGAGTHHIPASQAALMPHDQQLPVLYDPRTAELVVIDLDDPRLRVTPDGELIFAVPWRLRDIALTAFGGAAFLLIHMIILLLWFS